VKRGEMGKMGEIGNATAAATTVQHLRSIETAVALATAADFQAYLIYD
jgi:hypothetical protein